MKTIWILAAMSALILLVACGEDDSVITPVSIDFESNTLTISEAATPQTVNITFGDELPIASSVEISLSGTAVYGTDFMTNPSGMSGSFDITLAAGTSSTSFTLAPIDNDEVDGDRTVILTISSAATGIDLGSSLSFTATITNDDTEPEPTSVDISVMASKFYHSDAVSVSFDDTWVTITSSDLPDHKSMYYSADNPLYEDYTEPNNPDFKKNPGEIAAQSYVFKIPRFPAEASVKESTPMGPMGVSINSVVFFNQSAAPGDDILEELNTFDQYEGHPAGDAYHYHIEPTWLTQEAGAEAFMGFLLDGFPVYGPEENGVTLTNDDLDDYHGHNTATADFPDGIYHYHITAELPWINGDGFYGTPGTITQ